MKLLLGTIAASAALAMPAFAQDTAMDYSTTTCADLSAMDEAGQMTALQGMQTAMAGDMATDSMAAGDDAAAGDTAATTDTTAATSDTMAADDTAAASTDMAASDDTAAGDAEMATADAPGDSAADDSMASGTMSMDEPMVTAMMAACASDPSMMVMDAMTQAQSN